jgi:hypothetical protein
MNQQGQGGPGQYPVDNNTYNLLQMLVSKLEALEVYAKYQQDADQQTRGLIQELAQQDSQHARRILDTLKQALQRQ